MTAWAVGWREHGQRSDWHRLTDAEGPWLLCGRQRPQFGGSVTAVEYRRREPTCSACRLKEGYLAYKLTPRWRLFRRARLRRYWGSALMQELGR